MHIWDHGTSIQSCAGSCSAATRSVSHNTSGEQAHLAQSIHSPVIAYPDDPVTLLCALLGRKNTSKVVVYSTMRNDSWWTTLYDVNWDHEPAREGLDLGETVSKVTQDRIKMRSKAKILEKVVLTSGSPPHSPVSATSVQYFLNSDCVMIPSCSVAPSLSSPVIDGKNGIKSSGCSSMY